MGSKTLVVISVDRPQAHESEMLCLLRFVIRNYHRLCLEGSVQDTSQVHYYYLQNITIEQLIAFAFEFV